MTPTPMTEIGGTAAGAAVGEEEPAVEVALGLPALSVGLPAVSVAVALAS